MFGDFCRHLFSLEKKIGQLAVINFPKTTHGCLIMYANETPRGPERQLCKSEISSKIEREINLKKSENSGNFFLESFLGFAQFWVSFAE